MSKQDSIASLTDVNYDIAPSATTEKSRANPLEDTEQKRPLPDRSEYVRYLVGKYPRCPGPRLDKLRRFDGVASIRRTDVAVIARVSPADPDRLKIIAGACRLTAIRTINGLRDDGDRRQIIVELRNLDDGAALQGRRCGKPRADRYVAV